jgi:hypothetical protein
MKITEAGRKKAHSVEFAKELCKIAEKLQGVRRQAFFPVNDN